MKNKFKFLIIALSVAFISCEDESKDNLPELVEAPFVNLTVERPVIDVTNITGSSYGGVLDAPGATVTKFEISIRRVSNGVATPYYPLLTVTSFPYDLAITASEIGAAIGQDFNTFLAGDRFDILGVSYDVNNVPTTFNDLSSNTQGEVGMKQAYSNTFYISCPFILADAVGNYQIIETVFDDSWLLDTFEIVESDDTEKGNVMLVDPYGHFREGISSPNRFNVYLNVNDFGIVSIPETVGNNERQYLWSASIYNPTYEGVWPRTGRGFFFTCTGSLDFNYQQMLTIQGTAGIFAFNDRGIFRAQKVD